MRSQSRVLLAGVVVSLLLAALTVPNTVLGQGAPITTLQLDPPLIQMSAPIQSAIAISTVGNTLYYLENGVANAYNLETRALRQLPTSGAIALATGPGGSVYVCDRSSKIHVFDASLQRQTVFRVAPRPDSIAVLSNGDVVVAAESRGKLLHLFGSNGRWIRSFGTDTQGPATRSDPCFTQARVLVANSDTIYLVPQNVVPPLIQAFSSAGRLLAETLVQGEAIDIQVEGTLNYRAALGVSQGGLTIINSARADLLTGRIWLAMNGSNRSGLVYEYDNQRTKVHEYRFLLPETGTPITAVDDIAVRGNTGFLRVGHRLYKVDFGAANSQKLTTGMSRTRPLPLDEEAADCPIAQPWPGCDVNCSFSDGSASTKDCKAELVPSVQPADVVIGTSCLTGGTPASCDANVTVCRDYGTTTANLTHAIKLTCEDYCSPGWCPPGFVGVTAPGQICQDGIATADQCGCCPNNSPIVLNLTGGLPAFSDAENGVLFDINGLGDLLWLGWPQDGSTAFLARDVNGDGVVDNGSELFSNTTLLKSGAIAQHGYEALAELDSNGDGWVDVQDPAYGDLRLWKDFNRNGMSDAGELSLLAAEGIIGLSTDYRESMQRDRWGNLFRYRAEIRWAETPPGSHFSYDVFPVWRWAPPE